MVVLELHDAEEYCFGSGVAPQTPIPLYLPGQQRCFLIPMVVVFELLNAEKYGFWQFGALGWRPKHP